MGTGEWHLHVGALSEDADQSQLQNRQLYIQTELYLGTLAFFLEEFGRVVERLDEARSWKICRELADVSLVESTLLGSVLTSNRFFRASSLSTRWVSSTLI
jgi:hypothetical protein